MKTTYYVYTDIGGAGKGWLLAVLATSKKDADNYMKYYHGGAGRYVYKSDTPKADCGAVTANARNTFEPL